MVGGGKHLSTALPYIEQYEDRFNAKNSVLFIRDFECIHIPEGDGFGKAFQKMLADAKDWILLCWTDSADEDGIRELAEKYVLNEGTVHLGEGCALFNRRAGSLQQMKSMGLEGARSFREILDGWQPEKVARLDEIAERTAWRRKSIVPGKRYAIWGTGLSGSLNADAVQSSGGVLALVVDRDKSKEGMDFYGAEIHAPEYLAEHGADYDFLVVGHYTRFEEIEKEALALGVPREKILLPYEI